MFYAGNSPKTLAQLGKALLRDTASVGAATAVKRGGGGPIPQILAGIAPGIAGNAIKNAFKRGATGGNLKTLAKNTEKEAYATEKQLGQHISADGRKYNNELGKLVHEIADSRSVDSVDRQKLLDIVDGFQTDIKNNKINASDVIKRKKQVYGQWNKFDKAGREYLKRASDVVKAEAERIGKDNPKWHEAWKTGDEIHRTLNWHDTLLRYLDIHPKIAKGITSTVGYTILGGVGGVTGLALKGPVKTAAIGSALYGANRLGQVVAFAVSKNPKIRELAYQAMKNIAEGSPKAGAQIIALNKAAKKYDSLLDREDTNL